MDLTIGSAATGSAGYGQAADTVADTVADPVADPVAVDPAAVDPAAVDPVAVLGPALERLSTADRLILAHRLPESVIEERSN